MSKIHIGKKIEAVAKKLKIGPTKLGGLIGMSRDGVYKVYNKDYIDTTLLRKFSEALQHDFFKDLSEGLAVADPAETMGFATKDELNAVRQSLDTTIQKEFAKLREELGLKKPGYKISRPRKKK